MLCPDCRKLISVSAESCPHCGARRPGFYGFGPALTRAFGGRLDPLSAIPRVCLGLYVVALLLDPGAALRFSGGIFGILSPSGRSLAILGSTSPYDLLGGRPWTMLTAIYLHGGILHILFNLMWVRNLAPELQRGFGPARLFLIWTVAGVVGFLLSDLLPILGVGPPHFSVGASGSIFGLMAALIVYGRVFGASLMTRQVWQWAILLGVLGFLMPGVDNAAHVGGFLGGWIMATLLRGGIGRPEGRVITLSALALVAITAGGFLLNVVGAILAHPLFR
jgi:rhomboid protease GluP